MLPLIAVLLQPLYDLLVVLIQPCDVGFGSFNRLLDGSSFLQFAVVEVLQCFELIVIGELFGGEFDEGVE